MDKYETLKKYFNYDNFRNIQEECIDSILSLKDTLAIMATGGGKSIIFQVPGLMFKGVTIVVSPLISLMQDQVKNLKNKGIYAQTLNSSISREEEHNILNDISLNLVKFLYVSPERLEQDNFYLLIKNIEISQIVIDESHCINWGEDFRPSYLHIKNFINKLSIRPVISCFTATASNDGIKVIKEALDINPNVFRSTFDRPNLYYQTVHTQNKKEYLLKFLSKHKDTAGIIYTLTRKKSEEIFQMLLDLDYKVSLYHGGLDDNIKSNYQSEFLSGKTNLLVGTSAFGMGIDKCDIRFVINYDIPESIEDLSQQQGRCSRDGKPGLCILLYHEKDLYINDYFINCIENNENFTPQKIKEIKKKKRKKLDDVIGYATTRRCLHEYIVSYFGELYMSYCDNCSNCLDSYEYFDFISEAKIVINCLMKYNNRFGTNTIAELLCGIKSEVVIRNKLLYSPFFKVLELNKDKVKEIILKLINDRYVIKSSGNYPVIGLGFSYKDFLCLEEYKIKIFKDNSIIERILGNSEVSLKDN